MPKMIPERLQKLIDQSIYAGGVHDAFKRFLPILGNGNSGLFFFPEYTDHGPDHIRSVLATAVALLPEKAWARLTPEDSVVIALAGLLHDAAMVLTGDGLIQLITTKNSDIISKLDSQPWSNLFDEFYAEARRWDGQVLYRILGDQKGTNNKEDLTKDVVHIRDRLDTEKWTIRYRKFLGEFVRRHHARLAHEIARFGFPSHNSMRELKLTGISDEIIDLSGFVARSHNMALRSTYNYLDTEYDGHTICRSTHPILLMVLLRIADYLQFDATRVNPEWLSIQRLRCPISQDEWNAHLTVKEIRPDDNDPESLFISAKPEKASTFIKLKKTIAGLQTELDTSWAVLSEVYGRRTDLCDLGITVRRVRSTLDDEKQFLAKHSPSYYPLQASFDTSGASLLKLLIRPLYGDEPNIGIRELLQNAVDAVRELRHLQENHPELSINATIQQTADVLISIDKAEDGYHYLTISDKGIGMTAETVRAYFLKAGASFRQSDAWHKEFTLDNKSTVLRSGRFGIGALATFLLGDRIQVETRHAYSEPQDGVKFDAGVDDDFIELQRITLPFVGTKIVIRLDVNSTIKLIDRIDRSLGFNFGSSWDWYVLDDPIVERRLEQKKLKQLWTLPGNGGHSGEWRMINHPDYKGIHWGFVEHDFNSMELVCNGIRVERLSAMDFFEYSWGPNAKQTPFKLPTVSVFDEDARLPLTLHRDRLETSYFPFALQLAEDMTKDLCAMLLLKTPVSLPLSERPTLKYKFGSYNDWSPLCINENPILWTSKGITLLHPWHIKHNNLTRIVFSSSWLGTMQCYKSILQNVSGCGEFSIKQTDDILSILEDKDGWWHEYFVGARILLMNPNHLFYQEDDTEHRWNQLRMDAEDDYSEGLFFKIDNESFLFEQGMPNADDALIKCICNEWNQQRKGGGVVLELYFNPKKISVSSSPFTKVWSHIMKEAEIPYDLATRQRVFNKAYNFLKEHIEMWQNPIKGSWREKLLKAEKDK